MPKLKRTTQKPQLIKRREKTGVLVCPCGNRYLKTRQGQTHCLPCLAYGVDNRQLTNGAMVQ